MATSPAAPGTTNLDEDLMPATRRALLHRVAVSQAEGRAPSVVGAVLRDGAMAWCGSRSMLEGHEPGSDTQYRIGSLTKTFVAVLIMRLRDEGRLDLADPVGKYLDDVPVANLTIAQLLSHTAGLTSESGGPWWERTPGSVRPALADVLDTPPLRHPPGRVFHYSNPGFALLGGVVGRLRGHGWDVALQQEILTPLGMTRTSLLPEDPYARGFAVHPWADVMQLEHVEETGLMAPAGQIWSTAADLCRFGGFLLHGDPRLLPAATLAEMATLASVPGGDNWDSGYGLGLQIIKREGRVMYGHTGTMPGFVSALWVCQAEGLGAIVLSNATMAVNSGGVAADLLGIVADREPRLPERWKPLAEVDQELLALTGLWYWGPSAVLVRLLPDRGLEIAPQGSGRGARFRAEADGTWTGLEGYYTGEKLRLARGADGTVDHIDVGTFIFTRIPYEPGSPLAGRPDPDGWRGF
jgi:D-alanyl-D-alanine carboxypeptidase